MLQGLVVCGIPGVQVRFVLDGKRALYGGRRLKQGVPSFVVSENSSSYRQTLKRLLEIGERSGRPSTCTKSMQTRSTQLCLWWRRLKAWSAKLHRK